MDTARQQIVDNIKADSNILVTVSTNPTVDELSAALGLTILLDKMDKRATAVFSGNIPPALNFLEPDKTFENTADSLRDFIISLDKEKADHLRYKVDGDVVKIFITPYKTTLTQKDLEFGQGEFNVELVIAIGVKDQDNLDKALAAHGKILHDATVVTVTIGDDKSNLGVTDWHDATASSFSEMVVGLAEGLKDDKSVLDEQISTALLTGIVSATDRFSNERTSSRVMTMAAQLMAAGANQQLIAAKLEEAHDIAPSAPAESPVVEKSEAPKDNGTELSISRSRDDTTVNNDAPQPEQANDSVEETAQKELEESLAGLTGAAAVNPTMADIEKELQDTPEESFEEEPATTEATDNEPLTAVSDSSMPGFEAPEPIVSSEGHSEQTQEPLLDDEMIDEEPALPPLPELNAPVEPEPPVESQNNEPSAANMLDPLASPAIINQHGTFTSDAPSQVPAINSILNDPNEGVPSVVDPFSAQGQQQDGSQTSVAPSVAPIAPFPDLPPLNPEQQSESEVPLGTPEGAALLGADAPFGAAEPAPADPFAPVLPPLPPMPTDGNLPPLPPPPQLPDFSQPSVPLAAPAPLSGAVTGDVFGDTPSESQVPTAPAPAPEPGQYRIPGQ